jgi:hypothetical protein
LGVIEPPLIPVGGLDNVDALDMDVTLSTAAPRVYFSLDAFFPDPCTGAANSGSGLANGFPAAAILVSNLSGAPPMVYAAPAALGLDMLAVGRDDVDAIAVHENGIAGYQPSAVPFDWLPGPVAPPTDMLLFSVRNGSAVVGLPDSIFGLPIEPGDILTTPLAGGVSPFPGIFVAAEWLGLRTTRTHGVAVPDDLDALDTREKPQAGLPYCFGDGTSTPCPCGNFGIAGHGCANSIFAQGGLLDVTGIASVSADSITLLGSFMPPSSALYFQGTLQITPPPVFGDGLRCAGGNVVRLATKFNTPAGTSQYPDVGDLPVSVKGMIPLGGGMRTYQCWYRNAALFCTPSTFNLTNGQVIFWTP